MVGTSRRGAGKRAHYAWGMQRTVRGVKSSTTSIASIGSAGSIASIGSAGSIASIGSAGSILSIGSVGSILSIGSSGSVLSVNAVGAWRSLPAHTQAMVVATALGIATFALMRQV